MSDELKDNEFPTSEVEEELSDNRGDDEDEEG